MAVSSKKQSETPQPQTLPLPIEGLVLNDWTASGFLTLACGVAVFTIATCYFLAIVLHQIPHWFLPMISDTFVSPPGSYLSRLGIICGATMLFIGFWLFNSYLASAKFNGRSVTDSIALALVACACLGLATVGAVNEDQNNTVHTTAALVFFVGFYIAMVLTTIRLYNVNVAAPGTIQVASLTFKTTVVIVAGIVLGFFIYYAIPWIQPQVAVTEWIATLLVLAYCLSLRWELGGEIVLAAVLVSEPSSAEERLETGTRARFAVPTNRKPDWGARLAPLVGLVLFAVAVFLNETYFRFSIVDPSRAPNFAH